MKSHSNRRAPSLFVAAMLASLAAGAASVEVTVTDSRGARIADLPGGDYELRVWHYAQSTPAGTRAVRLRADETLAAALNVSLKAQPSRPGTK